MHYLTKLAEKLAAAHDDVDNRHAWVTFKDRSATISAALRQILAIEVIEGRMCYDIFPMTDDEDVPSQPLSDQNHSAEWSKSG
jgi:hypothetical protein